MTKQIHLREALYRRRFILPNLVTIGNMFCGFLSVVYASSGRFTEAVYAIFAGIVLDGLDGKIARRFNASSKFGVEFDSLSDLITFGIAPAFLIYNWYFKEAADEFGVIICFIYALCVATRLARFNVSSENLKGFCGVPSPAGAAIVVSTVNLFPKFPEREATVGIATVFILLISYLMVSNVFYPSVKKLNIRKFGFRAIIFFGAIIAMLWYLPKATVFSLSLFYVLLGPILLIPAVHSFYDKILKSAKEPEVIEDAASGN